MTVRLAYEEHLDEARELLRESLTVALEIAFRSNVYDGLFGLAAVAGAEGDGGSLRDWKRPPSPSKGALL